MLSTFAVLDPRGSSPAPPAPIWAGRLDGSARPTTAMTEIREVVPAPQETHGTFTLQPSRGVRLELDDSDAIVFARGPALVMVPGGVRELIDPLCAVWCRRGYTFHWAPFSDASSRLDWFAPRSLAAELEFEVFGQAVLRAPLPFQVYYVSPRLLLAQRLLLDLQHVPGPIRCSGGGLELLPMELGAMVWGRGGRRTRGGAQEMVRAVRRHLAGSFQNAIPVPEIAREVGYSPAHLSRAFKRDTGLSILAYRHELRMRAALELLDRGGLELTDVALELGYTSHSHFTGRFKRTFGITPSRFQRLGLGPPE